MSKLSIVVPSYLCRYAGKTVDHIFLKAKGEVEVVMVCDGFWPNPMPQENKNLVIIHKGWSGMRKSINLGVKAATGEFILKCDDHVVFEEGFDEVLKRDSQDQQLQVPSRYFLDVETWGKKKRPVEYEYLAYPYRYLDSVRYGMGLHAKKWLGEDGSHPLDMRPPQYYWKERHMEHIPIDEIQIIHGSCWFMPRKHFFDIGGLEENVFSSLYMEPQELVIKTWLIGGRCVVNKNTWYAHMHKSNDGGPQAREFELDTRAMRETERLGTALFMNDKWSRLTPRNMKWIIEHFWPIPEWPEDWEREKAEWEVKYPIKLEPCYDLRGL